MSIDALSDKVLLPQGEVKFNRLGRQKHFPAPRITARDAYWFSVSKHLNAVGMRLLNQAKRPRLSRDATTHRVAFESTWTTLSPEELSRALRNYAEAKARAKGRIISAYDAVHGDTRSRLLDEDLDRVCDEVARSVREAWDAEYTERLRRWGSKGGKKSKRKPVITVEMLRAVEGLSIPEQMEALHCSESTIARRRRELKKMNCN